MPGYVKYFFKDGVAPSHTKAFFNSANVLSVHNVILKNMLIFMNKLYNYPHMLPRSVRETVASDSPSPDMLADYTSDWYKKYNNIPYATTTYFKAPLLYNSIITANTDINNKTTHTFKKALKHIYSQSKGLETLRSGVRKTSN